MHTVLTAMAKPYLIHSTFLQLMKWRMMCTLHSMVIMTLLGSQGPAGAGGTRPGSKGEGEARPQLCRYLHLC